VHLVLGSQRHDLREGTVLVALVGRAGAPVAGADALWAADVDDAGLHDVPLPVGADAVDAEHVHRLADAGVAAVAIRPGDRRAGVAAAERGLTVLVEAADLPGVAGRFPPERVLVAAHHPVEGAVTCWTPAGCGPAAWGEATVVLTAGVRVLRTTEPRSMRRVATVAERLSRARGAAS
jgi:hypothetical protein